MARSKAPTAMPADTEDDYKSKSDARTLQDAAEIQGDPTRHAKAKVHLDNNASAAKAASQNADEVARGHDDEGEDVDTAPATKPKRKPSLREKVKSGLKKAFPND